MLEEPEIDVAQAYSALMDSVNLVESLRAKATLDAEEQDTLERNLAHIDLMLGKDIWTDQDLSRAEAVLA